MKLHYEFGSTYNFSYCKQSKNFIFNFCLCIFYDLSNQNNNKFLTKYMELELLL